MTLPDAVDTSALAEAAQAQGVSINPGAEWSADPASGRHKLRLCFANPSPAAIAAGIAKLADICHREFALPARSGNVQREP